MKKRNKKIMLDKYTPMASLHLSTSFIFVCFAIGQSVKDVHE